MGLFDGRTPRARPARPPRSPSGSARRCSPSSTPARMARTVAAIGVGLAAFDPALDSPASSPTASARGRTSTCWCAPAAIACPSSPGCRRTPARAFPERHLGLRRRRRRGRATPPAGGARSPSGTTSTRSWPSPAAPRRSSRRALPPPAPPAGALPHRGGARRRPSTSTTRTTWRGSRRSAPSWCRSRRWPTRASPTPTASTSAAATPSSTPPSSRPTAPCARRCAIA